MSNEEIIRQDILNIADCLMSITNELYESHGLAFNDVRFRLKGIIKRYEIRGGQIMKLTLTQDDINIIKRDLAGLHELSSLRLHNERLENALKDLLSKKDTKEFYVGKDCYMHVNFEDINKAQQALKENE